MTPDTRGPGGEPGFGGHPAGTGPITMPTAYTLIVFGRGVLSVDGRHTLTPAGAARVAAAVDYVAGHAERYRASAVRPRVIFTGGWETGAPPPPPGHREADLMAALARETDLARLAEVRVESRSRSTLQNLAHVAADGLLAGRTFDAAQPLGLVSHAWHLPRIRFLAGRVLGLRRPALLDVPVTTGDLAATGLPPRFLLLAARLGFLGARDAARLLRRERLLTESVRKWQGFRSGGV